MHQYRQPQSLCQRLCCLHGSPWHTSSSCALANKHTRCIAPCYCTGVARAALTSSSKSSHVPGTTTYHRGMVYYTILLLKKNPDCHLITYSGFRSMPLQLRTESLPQQPRLHPLHSFFATSPCFSKERTTGHHTTKEFRIKVNQSD